MSTPDPWWRRFPSEYGDILAELRGRGWTVAPVEDDEAETLRLTVSGLPDPPGWLRLYYTPAGVAAPPTVIGPQGPHLHVHPLDGTLCLPDLDSPAALVDAAVKLYDPATPVTGQVEPRTGFLSVPAPCAVVVPSALPPGEWGTFTIRHPRNTIRGWVSHMATGPQFDAALEADYPAELAAAFAADGKTSGVWVRVSDRRFPVRASELHALWDRRLPDDARRWSELLADVQDVSSRLVADVPNRGTGIFGLIVPEEGPEPGDWHERLVVVCAYTQQVWPVVGEAITPGAHRVPGTAALSAKSVAVAGLGMLGARAALDVARTGIGSLRLLDNDCVETGNLVRQPYGIGQLGQPKVDALTDLVRHGAPWCEIRPEHRIRARAEMTPRAALIEWLDGADLLITTTGSRPADTYLAEVAQEVRVPVVGGWVSLGIWGGVVHRTVWGQSGCRWCIAHVDLANPPADPDADELYVRGCGHPTFPGHIGDGGVIASSLAALAVRELIGDPPSAGDIALIALRSQSFYRPTTTWTQLPPHPDCPICSRCG